MREQALCQAQRHGFRPRYYLRTLYKCNSIWAIEICGLFSLLNLETRIYICNTYCRTQIVSRCIANKLCTANVILWKYESLFMSLTFSTVVIKIWIRTYGTKLLHLSFMYLEITELVNLQIQINWKFQLQFRTELSQRICIALLSCNNVDEIIGLNPLITESHKKRKRNYILLKPK